MSTGSGYKLAQLEEIEEGTLLPVGGKEVEISESISQDVWTAKVTVDLAFTVCPGSFVQFYTRLLTTVLRSEAKGGGKTCP